VRRNRIISWHDVICKWQDTMTGQHFDLNPEFWDAGNTAKRKNSHARDIENHERDLGCEFLNFIPDCVT
jgi:hypothetical protein